MNLVKKEVTELGSKYSMITPYTSFIAVLDTVRNKDGGSKDVSQPSPLQSVNLSGAIAKFRGVRRGCVFDFWYILSYYISIMFKKRWCSQ